MKCENCERKFDNLINVDGDSLCQECVESNHEISYCSDCKQWHYSYNMYYVNGIDECVCEDCITNGDYFLCHDCGEYYIYDEANSCYSGDYVVCDGCRDDHYTYVECCDTYIDSDYAHYDEETNEYYCEEHYPTDRDIYGYGEFNDWQKQALENEIPPFYIGFELEVENTGRQHCNDDVARIVKRKFPVICSRDGSLDFGFEVVSHPLSYNYIIENQDKLEDVLHTLTNKGYESHNPGTCGLHFHVTHPHNEDVINRIILIMETYKQELITFSRRTSSQIEHWCKFLSDIKEEGDCKSLYFIKKNKETSNRYMALNLTNFNTIEFRLFRGTLNFDTFMASVELVNNIMTLCSNLEIPIEEITWDRLTETQFAHTYCDMKNIRSTIIPKSNDEYYLERERKEKQCRENIVRIIEEEIRPLIQHNMIPNSVICASNTLELDEKIYAYARTLGRVRDFINIMKTLVYACEHDTSITTIADKINIATIYIPELDCYEDIKNITEKLSKEIKSLLGKESE